MKQPHEDVTGADRTDLLPSLDEAAPAHRGPLAGLAFHLATEYDRAFTGADKPTPRIVWATLGKAEQ